MKQEKEYLIVDKNVLPEVFIKVLEVKKLLEGKNEKTVQDAVNAVGISRSAFYKYRDSVFPLYENSRGKTVTIGMDLEDVTGLLSSLLLTIANAGANILTINQTIPINGVANVTVTIETNGLREELSKLMKELSDLSGIKGIRILARE